MNLGEPSYKFDYSFYKIIKKNKMSNGITKINNLQEAIIYKFEKATADLPSKYYVKDKMSFLLSEVYRIDPVDSADCLLPRHRRDVYFL